MMIDPLDRTLGFYGISIATSLALEGIAHSGEYAERQGKPEIVTMESMWVNLRTLVRNAHNAFDRDQQRLVSTDSLIACVIADWEKIQEVVREYAPGCQMQLYLCSYEGINKDFPEANFRNNQTPLQLMYETIERSVYQHFMEVWKEQLYVTKWKLEGKLPVVLLTHMPIDLLSAKHFPNMQLLESHTGVLKGPKGWWTKLNIKRDGPIVPFNKAMLLFFGDHVMFAAQPLKARRVLLKIAEKRKWHPLTTMAKVLQDVKLEHEPHLAAMLKKFM